MTRYLVAIRHPDDYDPAVAEDEAMSLSIEALNEEMIAAGLRIFAGGLHPARNAKSLRARPTVRCASRSNAFLISATFSILAITAALGHVFGLPIIALYERTWKWQYCHHRGIADTNRGGLAQAALPMPVIEAVAWSNGSCASWRSPSMSTTAFIATTAR
jgi:hypothetical protein